MAPVAEARPRVSFDFEAACTGTAQQYGRCIVLRAEVPNRIAELLEQLDQQKNADVHDVRW